MLSEWFSRLRFFVRGRQRSEVDEELQFHVDRQIEANLRRGMSEQEAHRQAMLALGGREGTRERCREARPSWKLELVLRDLRLAVRSLLRSPGLTLIAVLTLALAIGANSTIFSLLNQALLQSLPVHDPQQLLVLSFAGSNPGHTHTDGGNSPGHLHEFSYPMYRNLRDKNPVFSGLIAAASAKAGVSWNSHAEEVPAEIVSGNYFDVLGVKPALGRLFGASDETAEGANPVVVLSFDYWKSHLAEAPVEGKSLLINGSPFTIIGVAAPGFRSMVWGHVPGIYVPVTMQYTIQPEWDFVKDSQAYWLDIIGRLRPGITAAQAAAAMNPLFTALRTDEFGTLHDQSAKAREAFITNAHLNLEAGAKGFSPLRDEGRTPLIIIMAMVLLVIAMAIVNVASLLMVRAASRSREFSVRYALGASTGRIFRQLLCEGMLLGVAGAGLGLLLAPGILHLLIHHMTLSSAELPPFTATLNWHVFAFTLAATLLAILLFSLAPAVQFWNPKLVDALKEQARTGTSGSLRFRRTGVVLQIGLSMLLIVGAGMFMRTIQNLRMVNPGFVTEHLLSFELAPELAGYPSTEVAPVEQRALDAIANLPGVRAVAATNDPDLGDDDRKGDVYVSGYTPKPDEEFDVELPWVSNSYLQTLGIPLIAGRTFSQSDSATSQKVAIVSESFARHFFSSPTAALGQHVERPRRPKTDAVIVGVVADVKHDSVRDPATATCYTLFQQAERPTRLAFYVRTWQAPDTTVTEIRAAIANLDSKLIVNNVHTMKDQLDRNLLAERVIAWLATVFGAVAALMAGIGLYGILAYTTAQRTREIGIRIAMGAGRGMVVGLILREILVLVGWAVGITVPVAFLATRAIRSQLFGVSVADPIVYTFGILGIAVVASLAGFVPARRAASVDPARALRTE